MNDGADICYDSRGMDVTRVLVVEDEKRIADFISRGLESAGYQVATVHDGASAVERIHEIEFDLIVLDLGLPDMDGLKVLEKIRNRKTMPSVLISKVTSIST